MLRSLLHPVPMPSPFSPKIRRAQRGFTLAELLAVIGLSAFSLSFIFFVLIQSIRVYAQQDNFYDLHNAARYTILNLENDLRRIGLMAPRSSQDPRLCGQPLPVPPTSAQGFLPVHFQDGAQATTTTFEGTSGVSVRADQIEIMGNFNSSEEYLAEIQPSGIFLHDLPAGGVESFRRTLFNRNQLLMIRTNLNRMQIVQVNTGPAPVSDSAVNTAFNARILPIATQGLTLDLNGCNLAIGSYVRIAPLSRIRFRIDMTRTGSAEQGKWFLRRIPMHATCQPDRTCTWAENQDTDRGAPPRDVIENIVDIQFWFSRAAADGSIQRWNPLPKLPDGTNNPITTSRLAFYDATPKTNATLDEIGWPANDITQIPSIRTIHYRISVRSDREDRGYQHRKRTSLIEPLNTFEILNNNNATGETDTARVRTITGGMMLYNLFPNN